MTAVLYPVAANADLALAAPRGRAAREREAVKLAGEAVVFTTDPTGPAFATCEAALAAYAGRVEDERTGATSEPQDRYCRLAEQIVVAPGQTAPRPVEPAYADGRRWPQAPPPPRTAWRLMVSYWRIATAERPIAAPQARQARRSRAPLDPATLRAMARQPLRPVEPQQPLDIGLFETRLPEAPDALPAGFRRMAGDVVFQVQDFADADVLADLEIGDPFELSGLYQGVDLAQRSVLGPAPPPAMIFLYRRPLLDEWAEHGEVTLEELVAHVLVHEIGHHFGLSDADIHGIESA